MSGDTVTITLPAILLPTINNMLNDPRMESIAKVDFGDVALRVLRDAIDAALRTSEENR